MEDEMARRTHAYLESAAMARAISLQIVVGPPKGHRTAGRGLT